MQVGLSSPSITQALNSVNIPSLDETGSRIENVLNIQRLPFGTEEYSVAQEAGLQHVHGKAPSLLV